MDHFELMGQIVTVHVVLRRSEAWSGGVNRKKWYRHECRHPWAGWVVGFRWKQNGHTVLDYDGTRWARDGASVPVVMVSSWPTINAEPVPLDGYELGGTPIPASGSWTEIAKDGLREEMAAWPRDSRGRWTKGNTA